MRGTEREESRKAEEGQKQEVVRLELEKEQKENSDAVTREVEK